MNGTYTRLLTSPKFHRKCINEEDCKGNFCQLLILSTVKDKFYVAYLYSMFCVCKSYESYAYFNLEVLESHDSAADISD